MLPPVLAFSASRGKCCTTMSIGMTTVPFAFSPTHRDLLVDLFGSGDFPAEILDPAHAADVVIERLLDAGFEIKPAGN